MLYLALTDLGNILQLEIVKEEHNKKDYIQVIEDALILDTDKSTFSIKYTSKYGEVIKDTITSNPKNIYDRLDKARSEIEKREIALMRNLFIIDKEEYLLKNKD